MKPRTRIIVAVATFFGVTFLMLAILSLLGGVIIYASVDALVPAGAPGENINTTAFRSIFQTSAVLVLSVVAGAVAAHVVWRPDVSARAELLWTACGFAALIAFSGVNFWARDQLLHVNAQALIDAMLVAVSISVLTFLARWKIDRPFSIAIRSVGFFCVSLFGVCIPLLYLVLFLAIKIRVIDTVSFDKFKDFIDLISVLMAAGSLFFTYRKTETTNTANGPGQGPNA